MKKRIIATVLLCIAMLGLSACNKQPKVGVNILEQNDAYTGEFDMPKTKEVEEHSALWILTTIKDNGYKFNIATKTSSTDESVLESYKFDAYGIQVELFKYNDNSPKLAEIKQTGKFTIYDADNKPLKEFKAYTNKNFVIIFASDKNFDGDDLSAKNEELGKFFEGLEL